MTDYALWTLGWLDGLVKKSSFSFHRSDYLCRESVNAAITHFFCRECCIYVLFCQECHDYALFDVEFYAEFLEEILRNTQNFGRNSAEKIGHWSLCCWAEFVFIQCKLLMRTILIVMQEQQNEQETINSELRNYAINEVIVVCTG